eukprot:m.724313 g.724313  ORF g.724313 m.724313 type:complete len:82 (+) comp23024_c0_seq30:1298-1543(+)
MWDISCTHTSTGVVPSYDDQTKNTGPNHHTSGAQGSTQNHVVAAFFLYKIPNIKLMVWWSGSRLWNRAIMRERKVEMSKHN